MRNPGLLQPFATLSGKSIHLKVIACEVAAREFFYCAARSVNTMDITLKPQGLHDSSDACRKELQPEIDAVDPKQYAALFLGYGLCNNATAGIRAGRVRLVIPRAHDCITFFLGSKERYARIFARRPGTYYFTAGWIDVHERGGEHATFDQKSGLAKRMAYQELVEKYGEENAKYLFDSMSSWEAHYTHGALIQYPFTRHLGLEEKVRAICAEKKWEFEEIRGSLKLIQDGLDGQWDAERFLIVEPGQEIKARYDESIIECAACPGIQPAYNGEATPAVIPSAARNLTRGARRPVSHTSRFRTSSACSSMYLRRRATSLPARMLKMWSASAASWTLTFRSVRESGLMVVPESSSAFISPRPL